MNEIINFLESIGFDIVSEKSNTFCALYFSKGINLYVNYDNSVTGVWYNYNSINKQILGDSFINDVTDLQFILSKNVYIGNEFPYLMSQIKGYKSITA